MSSEPVTLSYAALKREPRWRPWLCFVLMLAALQVCVGDRVQLSQWEVAAKWNAGVAEGEAWLHGRLDIPLPGRDLAHNRPHDTAYFNGKDYNVFPPLMGFLTVALSPLHRALLGTTDTWLPWPYILLCFWPVPIIGYLVFRRQSGDSIWGAVLTASWIGATSLLPNLYFARTGQLGQTNHVLSQVGLLLIAADVLGRQRIWPALIGLAICLYTRQLTILYALPVFWSAIRPTAAARFDAAARRNRVLLLAAGLAVIVTPILTLNDLKFGNPLNFGYGYIYVNRDNEPMTQRFKAHGLFSPYFIPDNLWYMFFSPPFVSATMTSLHLDGDPMGVGLFITSPLMLLPLATIRLWWRDPRRRLLMLGTLPILAGDLTYHSPGYLQVGYNRFCLDFIPIWLAVVAPYVRQGWRAWFTVAATIWGALYFSLMRFD